MDYELMLQQHVEPGAGVTVGCHDICPAESSALRIIGTDVHVGLSSPKRLRITPQDARAVAQPMIDGLDA
jgi:ADP-glucose pyrophosphorylase